MEEKLKDILRVLQEVRRNIKNLETFTEFSIDDTATRIIREGFNRFSWGAQIAIGEGEKDNMPGLFKGEKVGKGKPCFDVALDPISGSRVLKDFPNILSENGQVVSAVALAPLGAFHFPYPAVQRMFRIVVPDKVEGLKLDSLPEENLEKIAQAMGCRQNQITVMVSSPQRNQEFIRRLEQKSISMKRLRCQIGFAIATLRGVFPRHIVYGIAGGPETIIVAAAARCTDGTLIASPEGNFDTVYREYDLVTQPCGVVVIGITEGPIPKEGLILYKEISQ